MAPLSPCKGRLISFRYNDDDELSVRPSVCPVLCDAILVDGFQWNLLQIFIMWIGISLLPNLCMGTSGTPLQYVIVDQLGAFFYCTRFIWQ